ncbi:MAG: hypothetical protein LBK13_12390 [Spirochaetales bacterium]|jgi:hypothetical protein|nr:hypothetical protein [Spirochaetales bacterium]
MKNLRVWNTAAHRKTQRGFPAAGRILLRLFLAFLFCAATVTNTAAAEPPSKNEDPPAAQSGFGAAFILGEPMGLSAKYWISPDSALDAGAGWSMYRRTDEEMRQIGAPYFYAEYLYHFYDVIKAKSGKFVYFIGIGAETALDSDLYLGVRIPFGLTYMFQNLPIDIFLEIAPSLVILPGITSDTGASTGLRYWF